MSSIGILLGILIGLFYPLGIALLFKTYKFKDKIWKNFIIAFILGILFFFIGLIRKIYANFIPTPDLYWVDLFITGFVEEGMKLVAIFIILKKMDADVNNGTYYGLIVGLGFGAGEMLYILPSIAAAVPAFENAIISNTIWYIILPTPPLSYIFLYNIYYYFASIILMISTPNIFGLSLLAIYERLVTVLFHTASAILIGYGFSAERPTINLKAFVLKPSIIYYLIAVGLHICLNLFAVLYYLGFLTIFIVEIVISLIALPLFIIIIKMLLFKMK